jgi:hypothetical protein
MIEDVQTDAVAAMAADPQLRSDILNIVQSEVYSSSSINFSKMTNKEAWGLFVQWMSQGNNRANSAGLTFQRALKSGTYEMGAAVREALQVMTLSAQAIEGDPLTDPVYRSVINGRLRELIGQEPDIDQTNAFVASVQKATGDLYLRSQPTALTLLEVQEANLEAIAALGLESGNPESILGALQLMRPTSTMPVDSGLKTTGHWQFRSISTGITRRGSRTPCSMKLLTHTSRA